MTSRWTAIKDTILDYVKPSHRCIWGLLIVVVLAFPGCNPTDDPPSKSATESTKTDSLTGEQILEMVKTRYATAQSYSDGGRLYLSFQLNGAWVQEPKPWAFRFDRPNRFVAELYNSEIISDGSFLSCFVYDNDSGNLDNQQVLSPNTTGSLDRLFQDPIARHFISGANELPLAARNDASSNENSSNTPALVPPTIGLLTGIGQPDWIANPVSVQRFADDKVDDIDCYVIRPCGTYAVDLWIEKTTGIIWQMLLPNELLDPQVLSSEEVQDLQLIARFNGAKFSIGADVDPIVIEQHRNAKLVRQFVKLPDDLPSELVGQVAGDFVLHESSSRSIGREQLKGKTTVLAWAVGKSPELIVQQIARLQREPASKDVQFRVVFSAGEFAGAEPFVLRPELAKAVNDAGVAILFDPELAACEALRIEAVPALVVLDVNSKVSYARALVGDEWPNEASVAIKRILRGDDIANEMLVEYRQFLETYHDRLVANSLDNNQGTLVSSESKQTLTTRQVWQQAELQQPGNLTAVGTGAAAKFLVFDGWQTLVELDLEGQITKTISLGIPDGVAANTLRIVAPGTSDQKAAVFMKSGKQTFLFDANWKPIGQYPALTSNFGPIADCQFADLDGAGELELVVAFGDGGVQRVNITTGQGGNLSPQIVSRITADMELGIGNGKLVALTNGQRDYPVNKQWRWHGLTVASATYFGVAENEERATFANGLDEKGNLQWSRPISFTPIESAVSRLSSAVIDGQLVWGVLNNQLELTLFQSDGTQVGALDFPAAVDGYALIELENKIGVAISSGNRLTLLAIER